MMNENKHTTIIISSNKWLVPYILINLLSLTHFLITKNPILLNGVVILSIIKILSFYIFEFKLVNNQLIVFLRFTKLVRNIIDLKDIKHLYIRETSYTKLFDLKNIILDYEDDKTGKVENDGYVQKQMLFPKLPLFLRGYTQGPLHTQKYLEVPSVWYNFISIPFLNSNVIKSITEHLTKHSENKFEVKELFNGYPYYPEASSLAYKRSMFLQTIFYTFIVFMVLLDIFA